MSLFRGPAYAHALHELHCTSFESPWSLENFQQILALPSTFGFGNEMGFILCSDLGNDLEILTLAVHPKYRRKGCASQLLKELKTYAEQNNKNKIFLEVNIQNTPAIQLYTKNGFTETGRRKNYYHEHGQTVDALCFTWQKPSTK